MNLLGKWSISALVVAYTGLSGCGTAQNAETNVEKQPHPSITTKPVRRNPSANEAMQHPKSPNSKVGDDDANSTLKIDNLVSGHYSRSEANANYIVRDIATWEVLYAAIVKGDGKPVPQVDFTKELVVGVIRQHTSGGHGVKVTRVAHSAAGLSVTLQETDTQGCMTSQAHTQPHDFVRVTLPADALTAQADVKSANNATFIIERQTEFCK